MSPSGSDRPRSVGWQATLRGTTSLNVGIGGRYSPLPVLYLFPSFENAQNEYYPNTALQEHVRNRRRHTWRLLALEGSSRTAAIQHLADEYEVSKETIARDIDAMDDWLSEIGVSGRRSAASRLQESQANRRRLHEMTSEARKAGDLALELRIRREIRRSISEEQSLDSAGDEDTSLSASEAWKQYLEAADPSEFETDSYRVIPDEGRIE